MSTGLLVVDVQPAYSAWSNAIAKKVAQRINNTVRPVVIMWVGEDVTTDTAEDVFDYLRHYGARPGKLQEATFIEKDYGFFRTWMDYGVDRETIVKVGQHLMQAGEYCSEDIDVKRVIGRFEFSQLPKHDSLRMPHFDDRRLEQFNLFETCGGGRDECLAEIELYLQMKALSYKRLEHLTY